MNTCGINQEIRKILNLVEESEMNPSQWLNESFGFVEIDHVEDPLEEANSLGNMTNWVEDKDRKLVRPTTAFERRNMLMTGWRDALKVERGEGKDYEQAEIDYRFFEGEFQSKGWKKGWTSYCIAKGKGERKYVKPNELQKFLDAGWHLYDRIEIHKKEQGKKGDKYLNTWIDKSWFPEYQKEGWEMGWDNTEEAPEMDAMPCSATISIRRLIRHGIIIMV